MDFRLRYEEYINLNTVLGNTEAWDTFAGHNTLSVAEILAATVQGYSSATHTKHNTRKT